MEIRAIHTTDYPQVDALIREAFTHSEHGYGHEAELVQAIRKIDGYHPDLELVALENGSLVGHALLSEATIVGQEQSLVGLVLAPIDVAVAAQKKGVGKSLLTELEHRASALDYPFISILGSPAYYGPFGYVPASRYSIKAPFDAPDDAFMIKPLTPHALDNIAGTLQYSTAFD